MITRAVTTALISLAPLFASAAEVIEFKTPVTSELRVEAVLCKTPEALYLLYEASSVAMKGGGKAAFQSYFEAAAKALEQAGECVLEKEPQKVKVTAMATLTNPLKMPAGEKVYGRFQLGGLKRDVYAMGEDLPGLLAFIKAPEHSAAK
ncbi:TPA: hypothetical protein ACP32N_005124 [Pseudomonas aeruginosa]